MMDWTDRHDRVFLRQFSTRALLYTEMVTSAALFHGDATYLLQHDPREQPVALQLGGSDPDELARAAELGENAGYSEINLNVGCPSDRVQSGSFGACLMLQPALVARCIAAMVAAVSIPVTVKCRIGVDDRDSEAELQEFIDCVQDAGCKLFVIHARKAILKGLSPRENREVPPLEYDRVYRLKLKFPHLSFVLNGGITSLEQALSHLTRVDGVMLGRAAYQNPYLLHGVDSRLFGDTVRSKTRVEYLLAYLPYVEAELNKGTPLPHMARHVLGLFKGQRGGRQFRRHLSEHARDRGAGINVLREALSYVSQTQT